jgi:hypothetical protein
MPKFERIPTDRLHKSSGRAVVTLNGRDIYLGAYGSSASREKYDRLIRRWLDHGRTLPSPKTSEEGERPRPRVKTSVAGSNRRQDRTISPFPSCRVTLGRCRSCRVGGETRGGSRRPQVEVGVIT